MIRVSSVRRRVLALLHLAVFAFSASTSLLPCENADPRGRMAHHDALAAGHESHHEVSSSSTGSSPQSSQQGSHQTSHDSLCPLVIGCVGMVQFSLDASWRSHEASIGAETPRGATLGRVYADRSVDSPPPRV